MAAPAKIAIVTGAGSGIGRDSAFALVEAGFTVVAAGRRQAQLDETAALAPAGKVVGISADIGDAASVKALFAAVKERFGRLDVLFNNAGTNTRHKTEDLPLEEWHKVVNTNLHGTFMCGQEAFRIMKDQTPQGGRIINNGSVSAHTPRPDSIAYTTTKHAITGITKSFSLDGRKYQIACGQIDIGNAQTDNNRERMATGRAQADGTVAPEATMSTKDIARAVVLMATMPLDANVQFLTVLATQMPYIGRG